MSLSVIYDANLMTISNRLFNFPLAVKLETIHKPAKPPTNQSNYPQTRQTTHKPPTTTNQSKHPQTSQIPNKSPTNQPKIVLVFSLKTFFTNRNIFLAHPARKEK